MFPAEKGFRILLLCSSIVKAFFHEIRLDESFCILEETVSGENRRPDYKIYHAIYSCCKGKQFYIVWDSFRPSLFRACLLSVIASKIRVGINYNYKSRNIFEEKIVKREYAHVSIIASDVFRMNEHKRAIHDLGNKDYQTRIYYIPPLDAASPAGHREYAVVCLASSVALRQWEPEKFAELINSFIERYHTPVYLTGGKSECQAYQAIKEKLLYPDYIFDYICKTNMAEWVEIVRGAKVVISSDTGVVHLAAAVRTPSICIIGGWHYGILHPYKLDVLYPEDRVPCCVYNKKTKKCYGCAKLPGAEFGIGNPACESEIRHGRPVLCMQEISVGDVMERVNAAIGNRQAKLRIEN
jgi:ADP-heptose:LPS heptosyltransferase